MKDLLRLIERIGHSAIPVLLLGESGVGKEVVAEWVHSCSRLAERPLLRINCAGLTDSVVESELFGHERGAFTGAVQTQRGLFEAADGGTLLLDEVAELPLRTQAKLLRVLEAGEFSRLGSTQPRKVSIRFVAATHRCLPELVASGMFRLDLYYRLSGARLEIPPLRERREEIVPLARHFLTRLAARTGDPCARLDPGAERALALHDWPGNVRELRNVVEYAAALSTGGVITRDLLELEAGVGASRASVVPPAPPPAAAGDLTKASEALRERLECFERQCIEAALTRCQNNQTRAARELGISRRTMTNKLAKHQLERRRQLALRSALDAPNGGD
jgi:DNA-binding NtrC family response regulator